MSSILKGKVRRDRANAMIVPVAVGAIGCLPGDLLGFAQREAFIDTGASLSMMTEALMDEIALPRTDEVVTCTNAVSVIDDHVRLFDLGFVVPPQVGIGFRPLSHQVRRCKAVRMAQPIAGCDIVLGMDVLMVLGLALLPNEEFHLFF